jgi:hypothetical protein
MTLLIHLLNIHDITLTSKETFSDGVTISETFSYDSQTLQITEKIKTTDGRLFKHAYKYPNNFNCGIYPSMIQKNMFSNIVEEQVYQSNYYIGGNVIEYSWSKDGKNILPVKLYYSELTDAVSSPSTYSCSGVNTAIFPYTTVWYNEYDPFGNINYIVHNDNTNIVYLWSYNGQYLVAEIKDATYEQASKAVSEVFGMTIDALSKAVNPDASKLQLLYKNTNLTNALVTTYTYRPLTGILTMTGPSGLITYFDYDIFGRLKESYIIENGQKKILQANDYHYQK